MNVRAEMENGRRLNILKTAAMVFMLVLLALIIFLWYRNQAVPYLICDKGRIADKILMAAKIIIAIFLILKTIRDNKYVVALAVFIQTVGMLWFRFMEPELLDAEYFKIDRLAVTMCTMIVIGTVIIGIYTYSKDNINIVWMYAASLGMLGIVLSYDLFWMDFFISLTFLGLYMWLDEGRYMFLASGVAIEIVLMMMCLVSGEKLEILSLHSLIVRKSMGMEGSDIPAYFMAAVTLMFLLTAAVIFVKKNISSEKLLYIMGILMPSTGIYLTLRFVPSYIGDITGTIIKYTCAMVVLFMAVYLNTVKQWKQAVMSVSLLCVACMMALNGTAVPLNTWYAIMMMLTFVPLIAILYTNRNALENKYAFFVSIICLVLLPVEMVFFRFSAFKLYLKSEDRIWLAVMAVSYVLMVVGIVRLLKKAVSRDGDNAESDRKVLVISIIILATVIISMPYIIKNWIFPMMSYNEIMLADLTTDKTPVREMAVAAIMAVAAFIVPVLPAKLLSRKEHD